MRKPLLYNRLAPGTDMTESPGVLFDRLLDIMKRLRAPDGCPWDREQTRESLKPYLIEEAYEVLEAIESGAPGPLREELGDLLFQVIFHARLGDELGEFTMDDVLRHLIDKMIGRHPHVFGDASVATPKEALARGGGSNKGRPAGAGSGAPRPTGVPARRRRLLRPRAATTR